MWLKLTILFLFGIMISSSFSYTKQIDEEQFHSKLIDLHSFYQHFYTTYTNESSTANVLKKWDHDFHARKKSDLKTLNQMKN